MSIKVIINEPIGGLTDQTGRVWYGAQNSFTLIRGQRGTASIVFDIEAGDNYESTTGSPIYIHEITPGPTDTIVFAGRIQTIDRKWIGNDGNHDDTLTCVSLESCFDVLRIDPPRAFSGMTAGQILVALFNSLCTGVPVTLGTIDLTVGGILPMQVYRQSERVSDVFTQLATLAGINVIWGVKMSDQTLYFQTQDTTPAPFTLDAYLYETGDWKIDQTDYRNRQLIQISFTAFSTSNEMFEGDGITQSIALRVPVDRVTSVMLTTGTQATATGVFGTFSPVAAGRPAVGDTFTITPPHSPPVVEDPYTWVDVLDNRVRNQVLRGSNAFEDAQNAVDAINANPLKAGITFSLPTWENDSCNADAPFIGPPPTFVLRVKNPGSGGNGVILTSVHTLSPFTPSEFVWEGSSLSPFANAETTGGTDGVTSALNASVSGGGTLSTDLQYTPGSRVVTLSAPNPAGSSISIAYYRLGGDTIAVEDTAAVAIRAAAEHGTGKYQQLITDTQNADARSGYIKAVQALDNFETIPQSFQFGLFQALLSPGQLLTIAIASPTGAPVLLDGVWLVQEIQAVLDPGVETLPEPYGHFHYTVTVINVSKISTHIDFWENLAIVSPAGAQTVNNTQIQIATPSLNPPTPTNTTPPTTPTTGTMSNMSAGQQWVQEAPGRYALWKASDLVVDASDNTLVSSASRASVVGDIGKKIVIISGAGWTPGEYAITAVPAGAYKLGSSPAAVSTTGGVWALVSDSLWCVRYNISPSFDGLAIAIISKNDKALNPFSAGAVGPTPGGGDYLLHKGNQIQFAVAPDPAADRIMATYFPAGITPAPVGPSAAKIAVSLDVLATDFPQPYTPHVPPGGDRHFFDVQCGGGTQEAQAVISAVGTTDLGVIWSLVSSDAHTTDSRIGVLVPSPNGPLKRVYTAPAVLPSTLTPPLPNVVVLGVQSHADSTVTAFDTITLTAPTPPPTGTFVAIAGSTTTDQVMTSPTAVSWTARSTPADGGAGTSIASFGTGNFSALSEDSSHTTWIAITSTDHGVTWASHAVPPPVGTNYIDLIFGGGQLVGLDESGGIIISSLGVTWTSSTTITNGGAGMAYGAGVYVVVQAGDITQDAAVSSPDTLTWTTRSTPRPTGAATQEWADVCFGGGQFVAVGSAATPFGGTGFNVMTNLDGVSAWTAQTAFDKPWTGVAYGAGLYVAVTPGFTMTSADAVTWTLHTVAGIGQSRRIRFLNGMFVICCADVAGTVLTSPDGLAWTVQTVPINGVQDVAFG